MANTIKIKSSTTAGNTPSLVAGELGVNIEDAKLWVGDGSNNVLLNPTASTNADTLDSIDSANFIRSDNNVTVNSTDSNGYSRITVNNGSAQLGLFRSGNSAGGGYLGFDSTNFTVYDGSFNTRLAINTSSGNATFGGTITATGGTLTGNLGINTGATTPAQKLHIKDGGILMTDENDGQPMFQARNYATSATGSFNGNYGFEYRHATSSVNHAALIHLHENNSARKILTVSSAFGTVAEFASNGTCTLASPTITGNLTVGGDATIGGAATKLKTYSDITYSGIYNGSSLFSDEAIYFGAGSTYFKNDGATSLTISAAGTVTVNNNLTVAGSCTFAALSGTTATFSGTITATGGTLSGSLYLTDTNTRLHEGGGNSVRLQTNSGYLDVGPMNASYAHLQTDRDRFYFNRELIVDSGIIRSYDEDLQFDASYIGAVAKNIILRTGNVEKIRMDNDGALLINTTSKSSGTGKFYVGATLASSSSATAQINGLLRTSVIITHDTGTGASAYSGIQPETNNTGNVGNTSKRYYGLYSNIGNFTGNLTLGGDSTSRFYFGSKRALEGQISNNLLDVGEDFGSTRMRSSTAVYPTNSITLGTSANRWSTIYGSAGDFSGTVSIGSHLTHSGYVQYKNGSTNSGIIGSSSLVAANTTPASDLAIRSSGALRFIVSDNWASPKFELAASTGNATFSGNLTVSGTTSTFGTNGSIILKDPYAANDAALEIKRDAGANSSILLHGEGDSYIANGITGGLAVGSTSPSGFKFQVAGTAKITSDLTVGGNLTGGGDIKSEGDGNRVLLESDDYLVAALTRQGTSGSAADQGGLELYNAGAAKVALFANTTSYINNGAKFGIGTDNPSAWHDYGDQLVLNFPGHGGMTIATESASSQTNIHFSDGSSGSASYKGYISYDHNLDKLSLGAEAATIAILSNAALYPNGSRTLGTSASRWSTVYGSAGDFSGNLTVGGHTNAQSSSTISASSKIDSADITTGAFRFYSTAGFRGGLGTDRWASGISGTEVDLALYVNGDNDYNIWTNNVKRATFNSAGLKLDYGANPAPDGTDVDVLKIGSTVGSGYDEEFRIKWYSGTGDLAYIGSSYTDATAGNDKSYLAFGTRTSDVVSERLRIAHDGGVGIGLGGSDPSTKLDVYHATDSQITVSSDSDSSGDSSLALIKRDANSAFGSANTYGFQWRYDGGDNKLYLTSGNQTSIVNRLTVERDTGNVGIGGVTAPNYKLQVAGTFRASDSGYFAKTSGTGLTVDHGTSFGTIASDIHYFKGNVGIAETSPEGLLSFKADESNTPKIRFQNQHSVTTDAAISTYDDSSGTTVLIGSNLYIASNGATSRFNTDEQSAGFRADRGGILQFYTGEAGATASEHMRLTAAGKLGVGGVTSPDGTLHVHTGSAGTVTADIDRDDLVLENSDNVGLTFLSPNTNKGAIAFGDPQNSRVGTITYDHNDDSLAVRCNNTDNLLKVTSTGVGVNCTPSEKIHIVDDSDPTIRITNTDGGTNDTAAFELGVSSNTAIASTRIEARRQSDDTVDLNFRGAGVTSVAQASAQMTLTGGTGRLGLGTVSPSAKIHVVASSNDGIRINSNNAIIGQKTTHATHGTQLLYWDGTDAYLGRSTSSAGLGNGTVTSWNIRTGGADTVIINSTGLGIGQTPGSGFKLDVSHEARIGDKLTVSSNIPGIATASGGLRLAGADGSVQCRDGSGAQNFSVWNGAAQNVQLHSNGDSFIMGDFGCGTSSPSGYQLYVNGTSYFNNTLTATSNVHVASDSNTNLHINGATHAGETWDGAIHIKNSATIGNETSNEAVIYAEGGELKCMDDDRNRTTLSSHIDGKWVYMSNNSKTGKSVKIHMEDLVKAVEEHLGVSFSEIVEGTE